MKKLIAIFAVLLLAAPAMAADWAFYGSARMATFYVADDFGDIAQANGEDDDWGLQWDFQSNSRLGANVKADKVKGQIELGLKGSDGGDIDVGTRRAYGVWMFSDNASLKVGKDYSPVTRFISGQIFASDDGLLGSGNFYGKRPGMLGLTIGGFDLALISNPLNTSGFTAAQLANTDIDQNFPKIEASWLMKFGAFDIRPFGGFNYYKIDQAASTVLTDDIDIISYVAGIDSMVNIGAFYIGAQFAYGQNWNNANWATARTGAAGSVATLDGTDDTNDGISWTGMLVTGLKFTPTLKFEVGAGYRNDDSDISGQDEDEMWQIYGQAVITMAPGVYIIPEVGYLDKMDNAAGVDEGYQWYAGAKWQIDF
jgi:hypothetical protein